MNINELISPEYRAQLRLLHTSERGLGHSGRKHAAEVLAVAAWCGARSILDYGCGAGTLAKALAETLPPAWPFETWPDVRQYDPAVPGRDTLPDEADLVVCTDVLEHVEPERLQTVVRHLRRLTRRAAFFVIATTPGSKTLPDGRNAHLIVREAEPWQVWLEHNGWSVYFRRDRWDAVGILTDVAFWLTPKAPS